jgi:hypothetical protein
VRPVKIAIQLRMPSLHPGRPISHAHSHRRTVPRGGPPRRPEAAHVRQRPTRRTVTAGKRQQQWQREQLSSRSSVGRPGCPCPAPALSLRHTALAVLADPHRRRRVSVAEACAGARAGSGTPPAQPQRQPQDSVLGACCCPGRCTRRHADGKGNTVGSRIRRAHGRSRS